MPTSATTKKTVEAVTSAWVAGVVPTGFRRTTRLTWVEATDDLSRVLEVRRIDRPQDDLVRLTVEYGFYIPGFAERAWPGVNSSTVTAASGPYTGRIGRFLSPPSELWWFISGDAITRVLPNERSPTDISDTECSVLIQGSILPLLDRVSSVGDLVNLGPEYQMRGLLSLNMAMFGADSYALLREIYSIADDEGGNPER